MTDDQVKKIKELATKDYDTAIDWALENCWQLSSFWDTWAANCGAPKRVFMGHTISMIVLDENSWE